ncbi:hypothetical protein LEN26_003717 [Aphanomyces euteiches]|nr:hypothetical protein AeMF1_002552 [Aphanomyces euteiches]KAH9152361.1 hypothetical protein LEN26_003717 [Aphanomyces euteiches]KAH9192093.1 hypothetical protein AeNC1_005934 [Aphanomyces euteiches]
MTTRRLVAPVIERRGSSPEKQNIVRRPKPPLSPLKPHQRSDSCPNVAPTPTEVANVRTVVRIRPPLAPSSSVSSSCSNWLRCRHTLGDKAIEVASQVKPSENKIYAADHVLSEAASQEEVFQAVGAAAVDALINGFNGSIFTYGQSGSGKTYTMHGELSLGSSHRGLVVRILEALFAKLPPQCECVLSFVEIFNEKIFDLLDGAVAATEPKALREDTTLNEVFVQDVVQVPITSSEEAVEWLQKGARHRRVAAAHGRHESSKAHAVLSIKVRMPLGDKGSRKATLHCVDLAGSEKQSHKATSMASSATSGINKSLSCLVGVVIALVEISSGIKRHVPYRDSKLTFLLRDALGGNSKTTVLATVSPDEKWIHETVATLQFVEKATHIARPVHANDHEMEIKIQALQNQVATLQQALVDASSRQIPSSTEAVETTTDTSRRYDNDKIKEDDTGRTHEAPTKTQWAQDWPPYYIAAVFLLVGICIGRATTRRR